MTAPNLADDLAAAALALARRFARGSTMWCYAPSWPHHARHVAVEFVHPVIVGKRALPAVAVVDPDPTGALRVSARGRDVFLVVAERGEPAVIEALRLAGQRGLETLWIGIGFRPQPDVADHVLWIEDGDPLAPFAGSLVLTYHLLWELTHVCFEHPNLVRPETGSRAGSAGTPHRTDFLYPFLAGGRHDPGAVLADLARSAAAKMVESSRLRAVTRSNCGPELEGIAGAFAERFRSGGTLFTFGNGGSATDAAAVASLFGRPPWGRPLAARCLAGDEAVLTALSNDVGFELVFARQLMAYASAGDIALGISTSGNSQNLLRAFAEAKQRGLATVGIAGYAGGELAASGDVDHCLVVRSDSVHRIQECQVALGVDMWARVQRQLDDRPAA